MMLYLTDKEIIYLRDTISFKKDYLIIHDIEPNNLLKNLEKKLTKIVKEMENEKNLYERN